MSFDPHFKKTVLALHFDGVEDADASSLWVGLRSDVAANRSKSFGTATWKSAGVADASLAGRACLRLAATSDYYGLYNTGVTLLFDAVFTFEMVFYATATPSSLCGAIGGAAPQYINFCLTVSAGTLWVTTRGSNYNTGAVIPLDQWNHLAACSDGVAVEVFLNGVKLGRYARGSTSSAHNGVRVGVNGYSPTGFVGYVSDFRAYKGVQKYVADFVPTWPLPQFGVHADASPSAQRITAIGSALAVYTAGYKFGGGCLYLDGASYADFAPGSDLSFGTGDFTVEAWIKLDVGSSGPRILLDKCLLWSNGNLDFRFEVGAGNALSAALGPNITWFNSPDNAVPAGEWTHVALARAGATVRTFVNGIIVGTGDAGAVNIGDKKTSARIGASSNALGNYFRGNIDDFRITKGVARYTENFTPPAQSFPDGQAVVSGVVYDSDGNLCSRRVFVHSRTTGRLLGTALSDPVTGVYEIAAEEECYVVCLDSTGSYNAKVIDGVDPTV